MSAASVNEIARATFGRVLIAMVTPFTADGDLDLVATQIKTGSVPPGDKHVPAPCRVFNNNLDGTFTDVASTQGLVLSDVPISAVLHDDFDNDRDVDSVLFPAGVAAGRVAGQRHRPVVRVG